MLQHSSIAESNKCYILILMLTFMNNGVNVVCCYGVGWPPAARRFGRCSVMGIGSPNKSQCPNINTHEIRLVTSKQCILCTLYTYL